jgi:hypothetical protein
MPKVKRESAADIAARWHLTAVLSAVGGMGKSFTTEIITLYKMSVMADVQVFSADVQSRLAVKLGEGRVRTINIDLLDAVADDPLAVLRAYSPLADAVMRSAETGGSIVLDTAAGHDVSTIRLMHSLSLDSVIAASGGQLVLMFVTTSNRDAMRALIDATEKARDALPLGRIVWVLNERTGLVFPPGFDSASIGVDAARFRELRAGVTEFAIGRMDDRIWQPIERAGINFMDFVHANPADLAKLWVDDRGNSLDTLSAAVVQRRVSAWIGKCMEGAAAALRFS